ncbi:hypothetical protein cyc_02568 [Cyclospora cayetanensis]|uniref:Uncharacterized protein n=1 Tax=Cyclospora cayetanensis TaxID=88456 RepID=A0A1D3CYV9_9EIME|nr:hypothetical protein cyc_02568 [Cyclospora cayetanensis]
MLGRSFLIVGSAVTAALYSASFVLDQPLASVSRYCQILCRPDSGLRNFLDLQLAFSGLSRLVRNVANEHRGSFYVALGHPGSRDGSSSLIVRAQHPRQHGPQQSHPQEYLESECQDRAQWYATPSARPVSAVMDHTECLQPQAKHIMSAPTPRALSAPRYPLHALLAVDLLLVMHFDFIHVLPFRFVTKSPCFIVIL